MKTAKFAKEMSAAIEKAMDSGRCEFEQMRDAKAVLAKREVVEAAAHARLQTSLDYADSAGLAVALVKAEESGDIDDETLDAGWETQVLRVISSLSTRALLADLAEEVMAAKPTRAHTSSSQLRAGVEDRFWSLSSRDFQTEALDKKLIDTGRALRR